MIAAAGFRSAPKTRHPERASVTDAERWITEEVQPHEDAVRGYLRHQFPSIDPDDVVQESYLKLLRIGVRGKVASVKAYFFTVARHTALRLFQRREKLFALSSVEELPEWQVVADHPAAADLVNEQDRLNLVAQALDELPPRCRAIVRRAVVDGQSSAEIARALSLSESTVRGQLAIEIRKCTDYLRERGEV